MNLFARITPPGEVPPPELRRMRAIATLLLVAMAGLFFWSRAMLDHGPVWGFVQSFAEAAMIGGIADWFAVTALFRHPLGLPIPHTAIVPRNKDRIADSLARFLRDYFLVPAVVARRMRRLDVASAAGRWLAQPVEGGGRLRHGASRMAADLLESLDQERLGGMVKGAIASRLRATNIGPILGQSIAAALADNRHLPLLDAAIRWMARTLDANEHLIREMVERRANTLMRWTGLDERLANGIIDGLSKLVSDMADDPGHPLRLKAEDALQKLAFDLQFDVETQAKADRIKEELLDNPAFQRWIGGLWEQGRASMLRMARDPQAAMAGKFGEALRQLGTTLEQDSALAATINRFARRAAVGAAADYGDSIVKLVSDTIRGWDARTITGRLENAVGRDLQYIRINGTLVGGLVGLFIHTVDMLL